jgi:hypothetical protein
VHFSSGGKATREFEQRKCLSVLVTTLPLFSLPLCHGQTEKLQPLIAGVTDDHLCTILRNSKAARVVKLAIFASLIAVSAEALACLHINSTYTVRIAVLCEEKHIRVSGTKHRGHRAACLYSNIWATAKSCQQVQKVWHRIWIGHKMNNARIG